MRTSGRAATTEPFAVDEALARARRIRAERGPCPRVRQARGPTWFGFASVDSDVAVRAEALIDARTFALGLSAASAGTIVGVNSLIKAFVHYATERERHISKTGWEDECLVHEGLPARSPDARAWPQAG